MSISDDLTNIGLTDAGMGVRYHECNRLARRAQAKRRWLLLNAAGDALSHDRGDVTESNHFKFSNGKTGSPSAAHSQGNLS